jgi:hypothetical protein
LPEWLNPIDPQGFADSECGSDKNEKNMTKNRAAVKVKRRIALEEVVRYGWALPGRHAGMVESSEGQKEEKEKTRETRRTSHGTYQRTTSDISTQQHPR